MAYGRVYIGSTDGKVYSFGASSGQLLWSTSTGGYVYSSPAVWRRTVFAGSYSRRLVALDAATGAVRWSVLRQRPDLGLADGDRGSRVVRHPLGSHVRRRRRTGRQVWTYPDGEYTPVVADAKRVYLIGHTRIYALDPRG